MSPVTRDLSLFEALEVADQSDKAAVEYTKFLMAGFVLGRAIGKSSMLATGMTEEEYSEYAVSLVKECVGKPLLGFPQGLTEEQCETLAGLMGSNVFQMGSMNLAS